MTDVFNKEDSLRIKGVAILMMLFHHCFLQNRWEMYSESINIAPFTPHQISYIASFSKICVSLFVFCSGYGLYKSFENIKSRDDAQVWMKKRYVKSFSGYWLIVLLSWIVCTLLDNRVYKFYFKNSITYGIWNMVTDFLGFSNFFNMSRLNGTWWYMSAAAIYIIIFPIIYSCLKIYGGVTVLLVLYAIPRITGVYPGSINYYSFVPALLIGMIFAENNFFEKWNKLLNESNIQKRIKFVLCFLSVLGVFIFYYNLPTNKFWDFKWSILPLPVILFVYSYLGKSIIRRILIVLGKHSANIFMCHTFIRDMYCSQQIYSGHFTVVILKLLITSLILSYVIEFIKRIIGYDNLINTILEKI